MKHSIANGSLYAAFLGYSAGTGQVSLTAAVVMVVLSVLSLIADKFEYIAYILLTADRKALRKYYRARRDS